LIGLGTRGAPQVTHNQTVSLFAEHWRHCYANSVTYALIRRVALLCE